jgi:tape measure domain-containing protein
MAKQVSEILVKLGIQGAEGLDKLKSSFRELEKAIGPSNATIEKARRSIIEFGEASGRTEQIIRGQLEAFKGLRSQAEIGSNTYNKLGASIATLETELRGSTAAIDRQREAITGATGAAERNEAALRRQIQALTALQQQTRPGSSAFAQLGRDIDSVKSRLSGLSTEAQQFSRTLNAGFGATPERLSGQIATLRRGLAGLRFDSEQYLETLERIRLMTITQGGRTGRAEAIAGFQAYQSPTFTGGYASPGRLPDLPNTTAALEQQLSELTAELANVERGSARYVDVANRMADIQRQLRSELTGTAEAFRKLDIAQAGVERRSEKLAGIQEYYRTQGPMAPGVGGYRDPATGAMIMAGARTPGRIRVEESAYASPIGPQAFPEAGRRAQESIQRSLDDVNRIYEDARIRRVELQSKYDQIHIDKLLDGLELEGQVRQKGFQTELADFDRQLEARDRKRRGRLTAGQAVQTAGAVVSGGIFGGPEGFIGGIGGAVAGSLIPGLGTVGGSFAGAAIGAQVGALRQQLGLTADYAAQLEKLRIALRNVTGSSTEYNQALGVIRQYSQELAIPQDVITKSFTQLTAAVLGAGGTVKDAEVAFRGIAAGIRGTGGSVENLNAAVTATAQVFSKGKVSAEELRGQIGERLPGAFSLFAQSIGKTPQELDKALEQGQVSLLDFQKFAEKLFAEYGESAKMIADGPEAAGDRLKTSLSNLSESVGTLLRPIGAEFQNTFAQIVVAIDAGIRKLNQFLGLTPGRQGEINEAQRNLDATEKRIRDLRDRIAERPGMGATRDFTVLLSQMEARRAQQFARLQSLLAAEMQARGVTDTATERAGLPGVTPKAGKADKTAEREAEKARKNLFNELLDRIQAENELLERQGKLNEALANTEASRAAAAFSAAGEILANEQKQLDLRLKFGEISKEVYAKQSEAIKKEGEVVRAEFRKTSEQIDRDASKIYEDLFGTSGALSEDQLSPFENALDQIRQKIKEAEDAFKEKGGVTAGAGLERIGALGDEDLRRMATQQVIGGDIDSLKEQVAQFRIMGRELSTLDELIIKYGDDWKELDPILKGQLVELARQRDEMQRLNEAVNQVSSTLQSAFSTAMSSAITVLVTGSGTIKQVLGDLFKSIGESFVKMATDIIAQQLVMITLQTILKALGLVTGAAGAAGAAGGADAAGNVAPNLNLGPTGPTIGGFPAAANGAYFDGPTAHFARGGIVAKPTFFKFANGGQMQNGLMGEAGPEAIMPLRRNNQGRLGVDASGLRDVMGGAPGQAGGTPTLNMTFQTTKIGGVEYVSRDQLEAAMAETRRAASRDGAKRGMTMTLDKLQQSPGTRSRVGLR